MSIDGDKPVKRRPSGGHMPPIERNVFENIWSHYRQGKSYHDIAESVGVSSATVERYVNEGDAKRGWEPLRDRLGKLTKCMQAKLFDHHSKKKAKHFEMASEAFQYALDAAHERTRAIARFPFVVEERKNGDGTTSESLTPRVLSDDDEKRYALMARTGKDLADLMVTWHNVLKALYIGEESEQMLKDLERFTELGEVTPSLREKVKEIVAKEEGSAGAK